MSAVFILQLTFSGDELGKLNQLLVELHDMWVESGWNLIEKLIEKLLFSS